MSTKTAGLRVLRITPGGPGLREALLGLKRPGTSLQLSATSEPALRGLRTLFPPEEAAELGIELIAIGGLASRICQRARVQVRHAAQSGQVVAAIADACRRVPADSPLAETAAMPGIHRALAESLGTLRAYGVDAARLDLAAETAEPYFAAKLRALGFVMRESAEALHDLGRESLTTWLERLVAIDPADCDDAGDIAVCVAGELEPSLANWLAWLGRTRARVTLIGERHPGLPHLFRDLDRHFAGARSKDLVDPASLACRLFVTEAPPADAPDLEVTAAPDLLAECEWAVRRCHEAAQGGTPTERIAIFTRDLGSYAPILSATGRRLGVRLRVPWRAPLLSNRLVAYFLDLLEALGARDVRAMIRPLRSPYSGLTVEQQVSVEGAIRDLRRGGMDVWPLMDTVAAAIAGDVPWLEPVLEWRADALRASAEPWEWFTRVMELADLIPWQDAAVQLPEFVERDARAQTAMQRALTERASLAKVRRAPSMAYGVAVAWIREAWQSADYAVPSQADGFRVVSHADELGGCDVVVALGLLEGILPRRPREDPILGDLERRELSRLAGLDPPLPTSADLAAREREEFIRLCGSAKTTLVLSYRTSTGERNNIPTAYIAEAGRLCVQRSETTYSRTQFVPAVPRLAADQSLAAAFTIRTPLDAPDLATEFVRERFRWPADRPFEPQQLRRAAQCGFRFFARDQLNLRPERRRQVWNRLLELPLRADLAIQPDRETAATALEAALDELLDGHVGRLAEWELAVIRSGGKRMVADWVDREFRARDLWPRRDIRTSVDIAGPGIVNKAARDVTLAGRIPALARMGPYSMARLYETSAPDRLGRDTDDATFLYYALWAVIAQAGAEAAALEIETLGHVRRLFVLPRQPGPLASDRDRGLVAAAVTSEDDVVRSVNARARDLVRLAVGRVRGSLVMPTPSAEHCPGCAYGELCRRSAEFGETDDPFEVADA